MFRLDGSQESVGAARRFCDALQALPEVIPGLISMETGINENPAEQWHVVLTATLRSFADIALYASHQAHVAAAAIIAPYRTDRACVDYNLPD